MSLFIIFISSTLLLTILISLPFIIEFKNTIKTTEQNRRFECGLDTIEIAHIPFRLRFFSLVIIFLIFDIELVLLIPIVPLPYHTNITFLMIFTTFIILLTVGILIELNTSTIKWAY